MELINADTRLDFSGLKRNPVHAKCERADFSRLHKECFFLELKATAKSDPVAKLHFNTVI